MVRGQGSMASNTNGESMVRDRVNDGKKNRLDIPAILMAMCGELGQATIQVRHG